MSTIKSSAENLTLNADGAGNDIKFQSNASEVAEITDGGVISSTGGSTHADNIHAKFGTGNDLDIYHDGTHSYFKNSHTSGSTRFNQKYFEVNNTAGTESMISANEDSSVTLRFDGTTKLKTLAGGIQAADGILFGTDTADANALDDYEEGTWTPAPSGGTALAAAYGSYVKIGNRVFCQWKVTAGSGGATTGDWTGLPFTIKNSTILGVGGGSVSYNLVDSNQTWNVSCENSNTDNWSMRAGNTQKQLTDGSGNCWGSMSYLAQ
jgi:hypothetical protein